MSQLHHETSRTLVTHAKIRQVKPWLLFNDNHDQSFNRGITLAFVDYFHNSAQLWHVCEHSNTASNGTLMNLEQLL